MLDARWNGAAAIRNDALMTSSWPLLAGAALATVVRSQSWRAVRDCPYPSLPLFARVGNREETSRRLCGSLTFTACMRRTRNTDASRLARKPNEGTDASHNKGRPRSTRLMHKVPGRPESATMAAPRTWHKRIVRSGPRTASSPAADSGAVGLLTAPSFWRRGIESGFCPRSMALPRLVEVVEARFQLDPAHERGQLLKDDG